MAAGLNQTADVTATLDRLTLARRIERWRDRHSDCAGSAARVIQTAIGSKPWAGFVAGTNISLSSLLL